MEFYERIKKRRQELCFSQDELAEKMGYRDRSTIAKIESGKVDISQSKIEAFAKALYTTPAYLMGWENGYSDDKGRGYGFGSGYGGPLLPNAEIPPEFRYLIDKVSTKKGVRIPVLGRIPAGVPLEAIEDILDYEEIHEDWTKGNKEYFALKIQGDSMYPKYLDGDVVIFQKTVDCDNGADCAVIVNGHDATFKKIRKSVDGVTLQPLNAEYEPAYYSNDEIENLPVVICGIAKEIRRTI